jgi:hypothetical protein
LLHQSQETAEGIERELSDSYLSRLVILRGIAARLGKGPAGGADRASAAVSLSLRIIALALYHRNTTGAAFTSWKYRWMRWMSSCLLSTRDLPEHTARHLAEHIFHQIEPRTVLGNEDELKALRPTQMSRSF